jgi:hypothetical protein
MASPFDADPTGDDPDREPIDPNPDAIVKFGEKKITVKERKAALPEFIQDLLGAADAIARRLQKGSVTREEAYVLRSILNSPLLSHPDATGALIHRLGLSGAQAAKGKGKSLLPPDPTKEIPPVRVACDP